MRKVDPEKFKEKQNQILKAAKQCFVRSGFQGASISDICAEAGMSPGHLYHYFESKEAIIAALAEIGLLQTAKLFENMMTKPDVIAALLWEFDQGRQSRGQANSTIHIEVLAEASRNPTIAKMLQYRNEELLEPFANFLRKGQELGQVDPSLDPVTSAAILLHIILSSGSLRISNPRLDATAAKASLKILISRFLTPPKDLR